MSGNYIAVYLITSVFATYTLFRYMSIFFDRKDVDKKQEFLSYSLYFCIISLLYLALDKPYVNIISNLVMFYLLTYNYQSTTKNRLIAVVSIYMILMTIEVIVMLILQYFGITVYSTQNDFALVIGLILIKVISYFFMLFISNFKMIRNDIKVSTLHWLSIFIIPTGTLVLALIMISTDYAHHVTETIISIVVLLIINVFVFYYYDELMKSYESKIEKTLLVQQSKAYLKQLEIINQSKENLKTFRHDLKNHALTLKYYIDMGDREGASDYLNNVLQYINNSKEYVKSGNPEIDSLINYKMDIAEKYEINAKIDLAIPDKLNINSFDLSIIIGNLLDNAIEAASKAEDKFINISLELDRNVLYISISNSYDGNLKFSGGRLTSSKGDENHGLGLNSVLKSVEKYMGTMNIQHDKDVFYVGILMYNQAVS